MIKERFKKLILPISLLAVLFVIGSFVKASTYAIDASYCADKKIIQIPGDSSIYYGVQKDDSCIGSKVLNTSHLADLTARGYTPISEDQVALISTGVQANKNNLDYNSSEYTDFVTNPVLYTIAAGSDVGCNGTCPPVCGDGGCFLTFSGSCQCSKVPVNPFKDPIPNPIPAPMPPLPDPPLPELIANTGSGLAFEICSCPAGCSATTCYKGTNSNDCPCPTSNITVPDDVTARISFLEQLVSNLVATVRALTDKVTSLIAMNSATIDESTLSVTQQPVSVGVDATWGIVQQPVSVGVDATTWGIVQQPVSIGVDATDSTAVIQSEIMTNGPVEGSFYTDLIAGGGLGLSSCVNYTSCTTTSDCPSDGCINDPNSKPYCSDFGSVNCCICVTMGITSDGGTITIENSRFINLPVLDVDTGALYLPVQINSTSYTMLTIKTILDMMQVEDYSGYNDWDNDGYTNKEEIMNGYSPFGPDSMTSINDIANYAQGMTTFDLQRLF